MYKNNITILFAGFALSLLSSTANAQFGGLLDNLKKQAEQITQINKTETPANTPTIQPNNKNTTSGKVESAPNTQKESSSNQFVPTIDTAFSC
jgi:hypothetical protein